MKALSFPVLLAAAFVLGAACSEDVPPVPGQACIVNSDCHNPLSCSFMKCHEACSANGDCPLPNQRCVRAAEVPDGGFVPGSRESELKVCLLMEEEGCSYNSMCAAAGLVCGRDLKCRAECLTDNDCPPKQMCVPGGLKEGQKLCAEPMFIFNGVLVPADGGAPPDASGTDAGAAGDAAPGADGPVTDGVPSTDPTDAPAPGSDGSSMGSADAPADGPPAVVVMHPVSEDIKTPTTWTAGEHVLKGMVRIEAPVTIECGTKIRVDFGATVNVLPGGSLLASCTASDPIVFTSNRTSPAPGDWAGLALLAGSNETKLKYTQIEYAQVGVSVASLAVAALDHVTVRKTKGAGIAVARGSSVSQFEGVVIEDAGTYSIDAGSDVIGQLRPFTSTPLEPVRVTSANGVITGSATWLNLGAPYELGLPPGTFVQGAVTLSPGVELRLPPGGRLTVNAGGSLKALGTPGQKVLITSAKPTRGPGDWHWIYFAGTAATDNAFENTVIEYGGGAQDFAVQVDANAQVAFTNVTIRKSAAGGLTCLEGSRLPKLSGVAFEDNATYPLAVASNLLTKLEPITSTGAGNNFVRVLTKDTVTDAGTWRNVGMPYELAGLFNLKVQARIEIAPGTEIRFRTGLYLELKDGGSLHAMGTEAENVVLRSWKEPPAAGDWPGVYVYQSAGTDSLLRWTQIRHGGGNSARKGGLTLEAGAMMTLENSTVAESLTCDVAGAVTATASTFTPCP
jgi:hypothetical protein